MPRWTVRRCGDDSGVTLIELLVVMVIAVTISVFSVSGYAHYRAAVEHRGTAQELVSLLRNAQQRSLAEATTYCVAINTTAETYTLYKYSCISGTMIGKPHGTASRSVTLGTASFTQFDGTSSSNVSFVARGAATKGSVTITRSGSGKTYTINVEGLTGRVSLVG